MKSNHIKLWSGLGTFSLATAAATAAVAAPVPATPSALGPEEGMTWLAQGGEGAESEKPASYRLFSSDPTAYAFDVRPQVLNYANLVSASYSASVASARQVQAAIAAMLDKPNAETLAAARKAWVAARPDYIATEAFRFYDGPIDVDPASGRPGPEAHLNAWPLNEAYIDYVRGQPKAGIINDPSIPLTRESILARDQVSDEADVTAGWHAIEFLLWGQDFDPNGPGNRPASDYAPGKPANERRRLYLRTITEMLVADLQSLADAWAPDVAGNYRAQFLASDPRESLGRALNGMANLAGHELPIERLSVALDSGDQEDEHSCFSDTTHQDHVADLRGIRNVWLGSRGDAPAADGLQALVRRVDPALAAETDALFQRATMAAAAMDDPFEKILQAPPGSPPRQRAEAAVASFLDLGSQLVKVGRRLGVLVIVPGLGIGLG